MSDWLASHAQFLLDESVRLFGPPEEKNWKVVGIDYNDDGPYIGFPVGTDDEVVIVLSNSAEADPLRALYQFAHEVVHLLCLNRNPPTSMLEEGVAVSFSLEVPNYGVEWYKSASRQHIMTDPASHNYRDALMAYEALRALDADAIRKIRHIQPSMGLVTPEIIKSVIPGVDDELARILCEHRNMR